MSGGSQRSEPAMACLGAGAAGKGHPILDCRAADGFPPEWDDFHAALAGENASEAAAAVAVHFLEPGRRGGEYVFSTTR